MIVIAIIGGRKMSEEKNKGISNKGFFIGIVVCIMWISYFYSLGIFYNILPLYLWVSIHSIMGIFGLAITLYVWDKAK